MPYLTLIILLLLSINTAPAADGVAVAAPSNGLEESYGIRLLDYPDALRKASLLLLNRLPTPAETEAATTEIGLRTTLRAMMDVKGALNPFVFRAGHETFLTKGVPAPNLSTDFPVAMTRNLTQLYDSLRKEPVFLLQYIVDNDRPWTDVVSADYTVMSKPAADALGATLLDGGFSTADPNEAHPVRLPVLSARFPDKAYPHSGVLSSSAWLGRYPTTDSNRNRKRAATLYKQFMAVDIEAFAQRPLDDSQNGGFLVPTLENPKCIGCHTLMDPVAGAFQAWGSDQRYYSSFNVAGNAKDSLPHIYKNTTLYPFDHNSQRWYHTGDTWYRDMLMPGFNGKVVPGGYAPYGSPTWTTSPNLLVNPSAENGIQNWVVGKGLLEASNQGICPRIPRVPIKGSYLFHIGSCNTALPEALAWQDVAVESFSSIIDQGKAEADFGAYIGFSNLGTAISRDTPQVWLAFLDKTGNELGKSTILTQADKGIQNWANKSVSQSIPAGTRVVRFNIRGTHSGYRTTDGFTDVYADELFLTLRTPNENVLSIPGVQDSLQWLGRQLIQDQRFTKGGVYFWYRTLFKRDPLHKPLDQSVAGYQQQMTAYNLQDQILAQLASRFASDQGHGAWNVKDLLVDMVVSPLFRAIEADPSSITQQAFSDIGVARLLTPEETNSKLKALLGKEWLAFQQDTAWGYPTGLFYGGFDGGKVKIKPNGSMNSMMSNIPKRMAVELSCNAVIDDFALTAANRKLFPRVEVTDTPINTRTGADTDNLLLNPGAENGLQGWMPDTGTAQVLTGMKGCGGGAVWPAQTGKWLFNPGSVCTKQASLLAQLHQDVDVSAQHEAIDQGQAKAAFGGAMASWQPEKGGASAYLSFHDATGKQLGVSQTLSGAGGYADGYWTLEMAYAMIPANTRLIRFHIEGRTDTSKPDNHSYLDDLYLRVGVPSGVSDGEKHIRQNLQYLHQRFLGETLALDDPQITRSFALFNEIWATPDNSDKASCGLYRRWGDKYRTKRAWGMVLMYLMNDARFLYE
jgi:hypothetical protein